MPEIKIRPCAGQLLKGLEKAVDVYINFIMTTRAFTIIDAEDDYAAS